MKKAKIIKTCSLAVYVECPYCQQQNWTSVDIEKMKAEVECDCGKMIAVDISDKFIDQNR